MHSVVVDSPSIFSSHTRRALPLQWSSPQWLLIIRAAALRILLKLVAVIILVLIPWKAAQ